MTSTKDLLSLSSSRASSYTRIFAMGSGRPPRPVQLLMELLEHELAVAATDVAGPLQVLDLFVDGGDDLGPQGPELDCPYPCRAPVGYARGSAQGSLERAASCRPFEAGVMGT